MRARLFAACVAIAACAASTPAVDRVDRQASQAPGAQACAALAAASFPATTLTTSYADAADAGTGRGAQPALPAHCIVRGAIAPRVGVGGRTFETRFELRLPTSWSGRFFYQGGGGNDGVVGLAVGRNTGAFGENALSRGFAVVSTDAGHQGGSPDFGLDPEARIDNAYRAHDRTATMAKALVARYYGRPADRSYFVGCSGGGRQGMMFAQRYPAHFDGIVACAPAMSVSSGATIAAAWDTITYQSIAPRDATGQPVLSQALSAADLDVVAAAILAACDGDDGLVDGQVQRVSSCRFDPRLVQCAPGQAANCLTPAQVSALGRAFGGPVDSTGRRLYVTQPWDPGIAAPGWRMWKLGTSTTATPNAANTTLMAGALAHYFFTPPDPSFAITGFDFDRDPVRMQAHSAEFDTFRNVSLAGFRARGGKLLVFHGAADGIFSATESMDYFARMAAASGGGSSVRAWARLFIVPGMNHCSGGPATDSFDGLAAIVDWVERGVAPDRVIASALPAQRWFPNRTRPLCPFPAYARYVGRGDVERAENFVCTE